MRPFFAFSMLLAGLLMATLAPTASFQEPLRQGASGNTCNFGDPLVAADCANTNGTRGLLGHDAYGAYGYHAGNAGYLGGSSYGAYAENDNGFFGFLGGNVRAVGGATNDGTYGFLGSAQGAYGEHNSGTYGYLGSTMFGAFGGYRSFGRSSGYLGSINYGAYGENDNDNYGYLGGSSYGAFGGNDNGNAGYLGGTTIAVYGQHINANTGLLASTNYGAYGFHSTGNWGVLGGSIYGAHGRNTNGNRGYLGHDSYGVWGTGSPWAGYFVGNVHITGTLTQGSAASKVDHPLDPAGKYLSQSFVESPEMKTVYDGTVTTDARGEAVVELPPYVEALNGEFRYQLTVIGQFAQAIVAEKIQGHRFVIRTDQPRVEVSWQVTGIRHDPWAEANRLVVEEAKPADERGFYLHPRLYGQPEALRIGRVEEEQAALDHEAVQQQIDEQRRRMDEERQQIDEQRRRMDEEQPRMQQEHERLQREQIPRPSFPDNHR